MKREIKKNLYDIKVSIESIMEYLGDNRSFLIINRTNYLDGELNGKLK